MKAIVHTIFLVMTLVVANESESVVIGLDSFENGTNNYQWDVNVGCSQNNDPGDCEYPYGNGTALCSDSTRLGYAVSPGNRAFFVTGQTDGDACTPSNSVYYWTVCGAGFHASIDGYGATDGNFTLCNTSAGDAVDAQTHEMAVSRFFLTDNFGFFQLDFKFHGDSAQTIQPNEHIDMLLM